MKLKYLVIGLGLFGLAGAPAAQAACKADKAGDELTGDEAQAVYECLSDSLLKGYMKGKKRWVPKAYVESYRNWKRASAFPAAPGVHGERFLVTFVNDVGAAEYMKYAENPNIPVGTVIAKESFKVTSKGKVKRGPLFFMEKAAPGTDPKSNDWYYMAVTPGGAPMAVNVYKACHECHSGFEDQGDLGYPVEEARM